MTKKRIDIIDAARGLSVILMVMHHALYDLVEFCGAPEWLYHNPAFVVLQPLFAGLFVVLSGVSSQFSRSNVKRGLRVIVVAIAITIATHIMDMPIRFGILHLLGFSMVFFGLTRKLWDSIPKTLAPVVYAALFAGSILAVNLIPLKSPHLWMFGWRQADFVTYDYVPILPWLFVFLAGTWLGALIVENKLPKWFYETKIRVLPAVGKRSLIIYIVHQPVLYGIVMAALYLAAR